MNQTSVRILFLFSILKFFALRQNLIAQQSSKSENLSLCDIF